jgi:SAM-dependent methyltransferase
MRNWFTLTLWKIDLRTSKYLYILSRRNGTFSIQGKALPYLPHADREYNSPWRNERAVEIPLFQDIVAAYEPGQVLEVGNVLSYYAPVTHDVVDKYEHGPGVHSLDIIDFDPGRTYHLIICVSTLEHVGWDEDVKEPGKVHRAIDHLRRLLAPGGKLVFSVPVGHNPEVDAMFANADYPWTSLACLKRTRWINRWHEEPWEKIAKTRYNYWKPTARGIVVATVGATA